PWGVRHGLVTKLELRSLADPMPGLARGSDAYGGEWFDLDHSLRLYDHMYLYRGIRDREIWPDRATLNIPLQYYVLALLLADAAEANGLGEETVQRLREDARVFQAVA